MKLSFRWKDLSFCKRREDPVEFNLKVGGSAFLSFVGAIQGKIYHLLNYEPFMKKREKTTAGITALSFLRVLIDGKVCDLDVGLKKLYGAAAIGVRLFVF